MSAFHRHPHLPPIDKRKKRGAPAQGTRIDWGGVRLAWGLAILVGGVGAIVLYASLTAPAGNAPVTMSRATDVTYQLVRMIPSSVQRRIAAGLGILFLAGGAWLAFMGLTLFLPGKRIPRR